MNPKLSLIKATVVATHKSVGSSFRFHKTYDELGSPISKTTWFEWAKHKTKIYEQAMDEERREF